MLPERRRELFEQDPEIHVASRMDLSADSRSELQEEPDPVFLRNAREINGGHGFDYTGRPPLGRGYFARIR